MRGAEAGSRDVDGGDGGGSGGRRRGARQGQQRLGARGGRLMWGVD